MVQIPVRIVRSSRDGFLLKWRDEFGIDRQQRCTGSNQRTREKQRRTKEDELSDRSKDLLWSDFWVQFSTNHLSQMSPGHEAKCRTMQARLTDAAQELGVRRLRCGDINSAILLEVESSLRRRGNAPATIKSNMDTLWSILTWGQDLGLIPPIQRPRRRRGKTAKRTSKAKGRSLTLEEIERMEAAIPLCVKSYELPDGFLRGMKAAQLIGMRLAEVWIFSWGPMPGTHYPVRLDRGNPAVMFSDVQKSGQAQEVPLTPAAAAWLRSLDRDGEWICRTVGKRGVHKTSNRLGRVVAAAGQKAGVVTKRGDDGKVLKCASLHDLRRTFAATLHQTLNVSELARMTRHSDVSTLLDYYADAPTPVLISKLKNG